jgi:hypothetical protein
MFWNEIRNHLRERLPAIIDFVLYIAAMTMVATVLLGLVWLYVEYGMVLFLMGTGVVIICAILNERRRPIYFGDGSEFSLDLGGNTPKLPPPGQQALPPPGTRQIGQAQRRALPGSKRE